MSASGTPLLKLPQLTYLPPTQRRLVILLDGNLNRFPIQLEDRIEESCLLTLVSYNVLNTPVTGTVPNTPFLNIRFLMPNSGLQMSPSSSNALSSDSLPLLLGGINTHIQVSPGKIIGELDSGRVQNFEVIVRDSSGNPHNSQTNKLFNWCTIEIIATEKRLIRTPPDLAMTSAEVQQVWNTI